MPVLHYSELQETKLNEVIMQNNVMVLMILHRC